MVNHREVEGVNSTNPLRGPMVPIEEPLFHRDINSPLVPPDLTEFKVMGLIALFLHHGVEVLPRQPIIRGKVTIQLTLTGGDRVLVGNLVRNLPTLKALKVRD